MTVRRVVTRAEHLEDARALLAWEAQEMEHLIRDEQVPAHITTMIQRYQQRVDDFFAQHEANELSYGGYEGFPWWAWAFMASGSLFIAACIYYFR